MATIIKIGTEYVNIDNVMSISIRDREVCLHRTDGGPYYITCYDGYEIRRLLDAMADRTKRESEEK